MCCPNNVLAEGIRPAFSKLPPVSMLGLKFVHSGMFPHGYQLEKVSMINSKCRHCHCHPH